MDPFLVLYQENNSGVFRFFVLNLLFLGGGSLWLGAEDVTTILNVELLRNKKSTAKVETHSEQFVTD